MGNKNSTDSLARTRVVMDLRLLLQMAAPLKPALPSSWVEKASLTTFPILFKLLLAVCISVWEVKWTVKTRSHCLMMWVEDSSSISLGSQRQVILSLFWVMLVILLYLLSHRVLSICYMTDAECKGGQDLVRALEVPAVYGWDTHWANKNPWKNLGPEIKDNQVSHGDS